MSTSTYLSPENVDARARAYGISRGEVCRLAELDEASVSRWFNGVNKPRIDTFRRYTLALDALIETRKPVGGVFIGIDPGAKGAFAVVENWHGRPHLAMCEQFEAAVTKTSKGNRSTLAVSAAGNTLETVRLLYPAPAAIYLEKVGAHPKQGLSTTFHFGHAAGALAGLCRGVFGIAPRLIQPKDWQKRMRVAGGEQVKENARGRAGEIFGAEHFPRKKDSDRADASLMAATAFFDAGYTDWLDK